MNRDSNKYTIIYASVMVILVAVGLAVAATSLKPKQEENERIDKMQQILRSINHPEENTSKVLNTYKTFIVKELLVDLNGNVVKTFTNNEIGNNDAFNSNTSLLFKEIKKAKSEKQELKNKKLPVFIAKVDGKTYYVLPMNGSGLWDAIWGYIAIDANDHSTVYGVDFGNKGETPGLGAEISTLDFANRFKNKELYKNGHFASIAVVKKGHNQQGVDNVDGITGGTLTSKGVNAMLYDSLEPFSNFLETYKSEE